jgi:hypothetical protein
VGFELKALISRSLWLVCLKPVGLWALALEACELVEIEPCLFKACGLVPLKLMGLIL